jgi:hypothetical protein
MARIKAALFGDIEGRVEDGAEGFGKADGLHDDCSLSGPILPELGALVSPTHTRTESRFETFLNIAR